MAIKLTFISSNQAKINQISRHLGININHKHVDLIEIQSLDLHEIIAYKAREAYAQIGSPVLVEDSSLVFNALGQLPGPLIKWFLNELDNKGLCELLNNYQDRTSIASVLFGYFDGHNLQTYGSNKSGIIADYPKGDKGFGWDPIFIPDGSSKTWAEMTISEQNDTSMRRSALKQLETDLTSKIAS